MLRPEANSEWRKRVDAVLLRDITPAEVMAWKNSRLRGGDSDQGAKRKATVTVNSLIRKLQARSDTEVVMSLEVKRQLLAENRLHACRGGHALVAVVPVLYSQPRKRAGGDQDAGQDKGTGHGQSPRRAL